MKTTDPTDLGLDPTRLARLTTAIKPPAITPAIAPTISTPSPASNAAGSPRTFGGRGAGSSMFWVDPERALTFVLLTAGLLEESRNLDRCQRLSDLVQAAVID